MISRSKTPGSLRPLDTAQLATSFLYPEESNTIGLCLKQTGKPIKLEGPNEHSIKYISYLFKEYTK